MIIIKALAAIGTAAGLYRLGGWVKDKLEERSEKERASDVSNTRDKVRSKAR